MTAKGGHLENFSVHIGNHILMLKWLAVRAAPCAVECGLKIEIVKTIELNGWSASFCYCRKILELIKNLAFDS